MTRVRYAEALCTGSNPRTGSRRWNPPRAGGSLLEEGEVELDYPYIDVAMLWARCTTTRGCRGSRRRRRGRTHWGTYETIESQSIRYH